MEPTFISPDFTDVMAREYITITSTSLQKYIDTIPRPQWQACVRVELQTFIDKTLRPNLARYYVSADDEVQDFLSLGIDAILHRAYEIVRTEAGADSIWQVYDSMDSNTIIKVMIVIALADHILDQSHPKVPHTLDSAKNIHERAGQFFNEEQGQ